MKIKTKKKIKVTSPLPCLPLPHSLFHTHYIWNACMHIFTKMKM